MCIRDSDKSNTQPSLVSNNGNLSLTWISSDQDMNANLNFRQFINDKWTDSKTFANGSDWFVNWADFPTLIEVDDRLTAQWMIRNQSPGFAYDV